MPLSLFQKTKSQFVERCNNRDNCIDKVWVSLATETCYKETVIDNEEFHTVYLTKNLRNPPVISKLMKAICEYTGHFCMKPQIGNTNYKDRSYDQQNNGIDRQNSNDNLNQTENEMGNQQQHQNDCQTGIHNANTQTESKALLYRIENCKCSSSESETARTSDLCFCLSQRITDVITRLF